MCYFQPCRDARAPSGSNRGYATSEPFVMSCSYVARPVASHQRAFLFVMSVAKALAVVHVVPIAAIGHFVDVVGVQTIGWCLTFAPAPMLNRLAAVSGARLHGIAPAPILRTVIETRVEWRLIADDPRFEPWHQC
jgi:hypothetical protein